MKLLVKLLIVLMILFAGCYYFKFVSTDNGFNIANMNDYKSWTDLVGKVTEEAGKLNVPTVNSITYWQVPFTEDTYYVAVDMKFNGLISGEESSGLYAFFIDESEDLAGVSLKDAIDTFESILTIGSDDSVASSRIGWVLLAFPVLSLIVLLFPTGKKKKR